MLRRRPGGRRGPSGQRRLHGTYTNHTNVVCWGAIPRSVQDMHTLKVIDSARLILCSDGIVDRVGGEFDISLDDVGSDIS